MGRDNGRMRPDKSGKSSCAASCLCNQLRRGAHQRRSPQGSVRQWRASAMLVMRQANGRCECASVRRILLAERPKELRQRRRRASDCCEELCREVLILRSLAAPRSARGLSEAACTRAERQRHLRQAPHTSSPGPGRRRTAVQGQFHLPRQDVNQR